MLDQLNQNAEKPRHEYISAFFFFFIRFFLNFPGNSKMWPRLRTTFWVILVINQPGNHYYYIYLPDCFFSLNVLPWVNIKSSSLCSSFLIPFVLFRKKKEEKKYFYLLSISKEIWIIKPQMWGLLLLLGISVILIFNIYISLIAKNAFPKQILQYILENT